MKRANNNIDSNRNNLKSNVTSFIDQYGTKKNIATTIGVASLVGLAVYSAIRWVPFDSLFQSAKQEFTKVKGNFKSTDTENSHVEREPAFEYQS